MRKKDPFYAASREVAELVMLVDRSFDNAPGILTEFVESLDGVPRRLVESIVADVHARRRKKLIATLDARLAAVLAVDPRVWDDDPGGVLPPYIAKHLKGSR